MAVEEINMTWIVVNDLKKAIQFYTEIVGLKLQEVHEEFGWAELSGYNGGSRLGLAQKNDRDSIQPGENGVVTLTVADLAKAAKDLTQKGVKLIGEAMEVPGHVKLQMVKDQDGNHFQLVEVIE